jgi:dienelactone hydrolase
MKKIDSDFKSAGSKCAAWLFLPDGVAKPPVVVMAHGLGAQRDFRLPAFAEVFTGMGLACLVFDYRNFGASEGEPRNLISPSRHLADWKAAVEHARSLREVDGTRLGLWGSSFSGGHVLVTAATIPGIKAVVSQVPFVDGMATAARYNNLTRARAMAHGLLDVAKAALHLGAHTVPVVDEPGKFALMNAPDSKPGYLSIVPGGSGWKNEAPARILLTLPMYRPVKYVADIQCPVLMVYASKDSLIPAADVKKAASKIRNARLEKVEARHFDIYVGGLFDKVSRMEGEFLVKHLKERQ